MAFRAQKVFGTFEKQAPRHNVKDRKGLGYRNRNYSAYKPDVSSAEDRKWLRLAADFFRLLRVTVWHE